MADYSAHVQRVVDALELCRDRATKAELIKAAMDHAHACGACEGVERLNAAIQKRMDEELAR